MQSPVNQKRSAHDREFRRESGNQRTNSGLLARSSLAAAASALRQILLRLPQPLVDPAGRKGDAAHFNWGRKGDAAHFN